MSNKRDQQVTVMFTLLRVQRLRIMSAREMARERQKAIGAAFTRDESTQRTGRASFEDVVMVSTVITFTQ